MARVDIEAIRGAVGRFDEETVTRTPVDWSRSIGEMVDAVVFLKMEHLQRIGSFNAANKMDELAKRRRGCRRRECRQPRSGRRTRSYRGGLRGDYRDGGDGTPAEDRLDPRVRGGGDPPRPRVPDGAGPCGGAGRRRPDGIRSRLRRSRRRHRVGDARSRTRRGRTGDGHRYRLHRRKGFVAGAAAVAPLITAELNVVGEMAMPVLSGGNLDMSMFQTVLTHELSASNRIVQLRVRINDRPGVLEIIEGVASDYGANIRTVNHYRADESLSVGEGYITFEMKTSGLEHAVTIKRSIRDAGFEVTQTN